jgi:hypothetical protein
LKRVARLVFKWSSEHIGESLDFTRTQDKTRRRLIGVSDRIIHSIRG